ncbi:TPA: PadR family transcriptional regulator [Candidatus Micrarchaeota archaeon]|nr:PadR family transcriptional regulator [Candidatus Micrarchaeota archaeon]
MHADSKPPDRHMEKRIVRHMFRTFVLWLISKEETHGYELIKKIQEDGGFPATANRLYPVLAELREKGLVTQKTEMHGKRAKKIYSITANGKVALEDARKHVAMCPLRRQFLQEMSS